VVVLIVEERAALLAELFVFVLQLSAQKAFLELVELEIAVLFELVVPVFVGVELSPVLALY